MKKIHFPLFPVKKATFLAIDFFHNSVLHSDFQKISEFCNSNDLLYMFLYVMKHIGAA